MRGPRNTIPHASTCVTNHCPHAPCSHTPCSHRGSLCIACFCISDVCSLLVFSLQMCIASLYIAHDSVLYSHHGCLVYQGNTLALCFALRVSGFGGPQLVDLQMLVLVVSVGQVLTLRVDWICMPDACTSSHALISLYRMQCYCFLACAANTSSRALLLIHRMYCC